MQPPVETFHDPADYEQAMYGAGRIIVTGAGEYRTEITRIPLNELQIRRGWTSLPRVEFSAPPKDFVRFSFATTPHPAPASVNGVEDLPGTIVAFSPGKQAYVRNTASVSWQSMTLAADKWAAASRAITGRELSPAVETQLLQPPPALMARLQRLGEAAGNLAVGAPQLLRLPETAKALEAELLRALVQCLAESTGIAEHAARRSPIEVLRRLERVLEENEGAPMSVIEMCAATGVSERVLRRYCVEHTGLSPHRYLWLRRMYLARKALAAADPATTSITTVATDCGFWELGRFAVAYRRLFGESPSSTLRRPPAPAAVAAPLRNGSGRIERPFAATAVAVRQAAP